MSAFTKPLNQINFKDGEKPEEERAEE